MIHVKEVSYSYSSSKEKAIDHISLDISQNQYIVILGPNGSGKSTFAKLLNALFLPTTGVIVVDQIETKESSEKLWHIRETVGIVFQNPDNQIVGNTVEDDVAFGLENIGTHPKDMVDRVEDSLNKVDMLHYKMVEPHQLSGGQKQKVAIAGIIAMKPKVIILDEATSMLDPKSKGEVLNLVKTLKEKENITIINITHSIEEAYLANRVIVMDHGKILLDDIPSRVFNERDLLLTIGLDVPLSIELSHRLYQLGMIKKENILNEEELIQEIWKLI